jgi:hypothetical protein
MGVTCGTQTITNVRAEQMDSDPHPRQYEVLGQRDPGTGTMTRTAVKAEQSDEDRAFSNQALLSAESAPRLGTQTMTRVLAEGVDQDLGGRQMRAIPSICFSS